MIQKLLNFRFWGMHCIPTMDMARVIDLNPCMIHHQGGDDALLAGWDKRLTPRPGLAHRGFGNSYISRFLSLLAILGMENQDIKVDWAPMLAKRLCSGRETWTRQMGKSETYKSVNAHNNFLERLLKDPPEVKAMRHFGSWWTNSALELRSKQAGHSHRC